jgi:hypothetical protein
MSAEPLPPFWPAEVPLVDRQAVTPSVDDVGALEGTRTIGPGGEDTGTFTDQTHPSATEVQVLIEEALDVVLSQLSDHVDPVFYPAISRVVAVRTAASIETSYYREQAPSAWERYDADLAALSRAIGIATWIA